MEKRAVVIGGGIGGLVVARVLTEHFKEVVVLERDRYPTELTVRKYTPQGHHIHVLLGRGYQLLSELFPRLNQQLDEIGIKEVDFGADMVQFLGDVELPRRRAGIAMRFATRAALEWAIRCQIARIPSIHLRESTHVKELILDKHRVVNSVRLSGKNGEEELDGSLFIDAMGRGSPVLRWLEELGFGRPRTSVINANFVYTSGNFRHPQTNPFDGATIYGCALKAPDFPIECVMMLLPDGSMLVTGVAPKGCHTPTDVEGFIESFRNLASPLPYQILKESTLNGPLVSFNNLANRYRHFEKMKAWPGRFISLGDSFCVLNPRFGQGMTIAIMSAVSLGKYLDKIGGPLALSLQPSKLTHRFVRHLARTVFRGAWKIATSDDISWIPEFKQSLIDRIGNWYFQRLTALFSCNFNIYIRFMRVAQMLDKVSTLFYPGVIVRVLFSRRKLGKGTKRKRDG